MNDFYSGPALNDTKTSKNHRYTLNNNLEFNRKNHNYDKLSKEKA